MLRMQRSRLTIVAVVLIIGVVVLAFYLNASLWTPNGSITNLTESTTTITATLSTTARPSPEVQFLSAKAVLSRIPPSYFPSLKNYTGDYYLSFQAVWKNISNSTVYYVSGCVHNSLTWKPLSTSTAKFVEAPVSACTLDRSIASTPGNQTTSFALGPMPRELCVITTHGRVDALLTLWWLTETNAEHNATVLVSFSV